MAYKPLTEENVKDFPNFTYREFACKCGGKYCNGFPVAFSYDLAKNLQTIRDHFGKPLIITSPIRCEKWNSQVGGVSNSKHKVGWACDFYINGVSYNTLANYVKTLPYFHYCYRINKNQDVIHYDITPPEYREDLIIKPVDRDETVPQLKTFKELEVKRYPGNDSDTRGYTKSNSIYNVKGTAKNGGNWYQIDDIQWVYGANLEYYPTKTDDNEDLEIEIARLEDLNEALNNENEALLNEIKKFKNVYTCTETGTYKFKIKMYKDESLYIK